EPAAWCIVDEPKLLGPPSTFWANKIAPRAAVRELCMGDADELFFVTEGDDAMPVLKPDSATGLEPRYTDANKFVEKDAAVRVASAFRHELKATASLATCVVL